ncbi:MAG: hypothetical protein E7357_01730 [Clostridiales bacterium]|nr:hypothetical protein [Clostridiales bacterium]
MKEKKTKKIDFGYERLADLADKYYNDGKLFSALKIAHKQYDLHGGDGNVYVRLADIYEGMGLHASALNYWYKFLDIAEEQDLSEIYEGIAVNYLNTGNESASAYYYNKLMDTDDTLPDEVKMDIVDAFSKEKKFPFRFVYPPRLADYSKELEIGSRALKLGDPKRAVEYLSRIERGSKQYAPAKELKAVAHLLTGEVEQAEKDCLELLQEQPDDVRVQATLAAVYLEQGRTDESKALALALYEREQTDGEDLYKVATVCCENGLHEQAYEKFKQLEQKLPYDGRMLYFKGVAAYKCGKLDEAERTLSDLCTLYPDAEVAKYYLRVLRERDETAPVEFTYFYHLPQEEREERCRALIRIGELPKDEAQLFGLVMLHDGYFQWCFDEMDGADHDLQYLALVTAERVRADEFIREVMLDSEVMDVLKIETLRLLYMRNENMRLGVVLCHIYRKLDLLRIQIGRKRRKRFLESYAKVASKFVILKETNGKKIKAAAEKLYQALAQYESLDLIDNTDDCACAIFLLSGLKELGQDMEKIASAFDANLARVRVLLSVAVSAEHGLNQSGKIQRKEDETNETDRL